MEPQDHSHSLTRIRTRTVAEARAPARGAREGYSPDSNPLLWRLLRYRHVLGWPVSRILVLAFAASFIAGWLIVLVPGSYSIYPATAILVGLHALCLMGALTARVRFWTRQSFLDELVLTELTPREICSAIAQSSSRAAAASFLGLLLPLLSCASQPCFHQGTLAGLYFIASALTVSAFIVLCFFALAWLTLWAAALPRAPISYIVLGTLWAVVLPIAAYAANPLVAAGLAILLVVATLRTALHLTPQIPALLFGREG